MAISQADVKQVVQAVLVQINKAPPAADGLTPEHALYAVGLGLDSMDVAELSAVLEDAFGTDPYSTGEIPETFGEIVAFYDRVNAEA
jgi:acyl carrier protein